MSREGKCKGRTPNSNERPDFPEENFRVAPLSLTRRTTISRLDPLTLSQGQPSPEAAPLSPPYRNRQLLSTLVSPRDPGLEVAPSFLQYQSRHQEPRGAAPPDQDLEVAPLNLRRRRSTSIPLLGNSGQREIEIKPLRIRTPARYPATPRRVSVTSTSGGPSTSTEAELDLLPLLAESTAFDPQVTPPRVIVFEEEPSPEVINRRLQTGHIITVTPPDDSSSESETNTVTHNPTYSYRVPFQETGINPRLLRVPHTVGKASKPWHRSVAGFPVLGEALETVDRSWKGIMADDDSLMVPPLNLASRESSEEVTTTPPNTAVSPPEDSDCLIPTNVGPETGGDGPIAEDLTPSYETSASPTGRADQPVSENINSSPENAPFSVTVSPAPIEASQEVQNPQTPNFQDRQTPATPENPPSPPAGSRSTSMSPDDVITRSEPDPFGGPLRGPSDTSTSPNAEVTAPQSRRPESSLGSSLSPRSTDNPSPLTARFSPEHGSFSGDRGRRYSGTREVENAAQAARVAALGPNSRELLHTPALSALSHSHTSARGQ